MMAIRKVASGTSARLEYFLSELRQSYITSQGEAQAFMLGEGTKELRLPNKVPFSIVASLARSEDGRGRRLCQNQSKYRDGRKPVAYYDCPVSLDSSTSVFWALSPKHRRGIEKAHYKGLKALVSFLEKHAVFARTGAQGKGLVRGKLCVSCFTHTTNRNGEPQLHTHLLIMAPVFCPSDGKWRKIEGRELFRGVGAAGRIYQAVVARELSRQAVPLERTEHGYRVAHIPTRVVESITGSRRREIEAHLAKHGQSGAKAARVAAIKTRPKKVEVSREELFAKAEVKARALGFDVEQALSDFRQAAPSHQVARELAAAAKVAVSKSEHARNERTPFKSVRREAGRLECFIGPPATGKTAEVARRIRHWSKNRHVVGLSTTPLGAKHLAQESGQDALTVGSFLYRSGAGVFGSDGKLHKPSALSHHARMLVRAARKRPTWKFGKVKLTDKSVVVVDGAHRLSSRDLERLLVTAERASARVVLVGNSGPRACAFSRLAERPSRSLAGTQVRRERQAALRQAATSARQARGAAPSPDTHRAPARVASIDSLLSRARSNPDLHGHVVLASSRKEAFDLNRRAQQERGRRSVFRVARHKRGRLFEGDRVFFHRNNPVLGVRNGDLGTIKRIACLPFGLGATLIVSLDRVERMGVFRRHKRVRVNLSDYPHLSLGYALAPSLYEGGRLTGALEPSATHKKRAPKQSKAKTQSHAPEVELSP